MSCEGENETRKQDKGFKDEMFLKKKILDRPKENGNCRF
jgi:hypothetical protein